MVRSNDFGNIGFLENQNRVVVALSRARCGFYLFGNAGCLIATEETEDSLGSRSGLYRNILIHMRDNKMLNVDRGLPITCVKHGRELFIGEADHFLKTNGGCDEPCDFILQCGHLCPAFCHTFSHDELICPEPCPKILDCGHGCSEICGSRCKCDQCTIELVVHDRAVNTWKNWDAQKSDQTLAQIAHAQQATVPKDDQQIVVFNETFRPIDINSEGVRIKAGRAISTIISRVENSAAIPTKDEEEFPALPEVTMRTGGRNKTRPSHSMAPVIRIVDRAILSPTQRPASPSTPAALLDLGKSPHTSPTKSAVDGDLFSFSNPGASIGPIPQTYTDLEGLNHPILPSFPDLEGLRITTPPTTFDLDAFEDSTQMTSKPPSTVGSIDSQILIQF